MWVAREQLPIKVRKIPLEKLGQPRAKLLLTDPLVQKFIVAREASKTVAHWKTPTEESGVMLTRSGLPLWEPLSTIRKVSTLKNFQFSDSA